MSVEKEVSTDGLTRCSRCRRHVHAGEKPSTTLCPFCDHKAPVSRRGGLLAASLFAMACGGAPPQAEEPVNDPVIEQPAPQPEAANPDPEPEDTDHFEGDPIEQTADVPMYGIAPRRKG